MKASWSALGKKSAVIEACQQSHTCALADGKVTCWGDDRYGQTDVPNDLGVVRSISAGQYHTCALAETGVRCWPRAAYNAGIPPDDLKNPKLIGTGSYHSCAFGDDGLRCWGFSRDGQLNIPDGLSRVDMIAGGISFTCATLQGDVRCWGSNDYGVTQVPDGLKDVKAIGAGLAHACALAKKDVQCWGYNSEGQTNVPLSVTESLRLLRDDLPGISAKVSEEKKSFLSSSGIVGITDRDEVFTFFGLRALLQTIDSEWAERELRPLLAAIELRYRSCWGAESLASFERTDLHLRSAFQIFSSEIISVRSMLAVETQRTLTEDILPAIATKLARSRLEPQDGWDIVALFSSRPRLLPELTEIPRLRPFAQMTQQLLAWMGRSL